MKPWLHAKISAKKFGGIPEDYIEIHNWFDQTKAHIPDSRHRLILHNSFGIYLAEQQFGTIINTEAGYKKIPILINSSGKEISIRDIAEQHVLDDLGSIPTLYECMNYESEYDEKISGKMKTIKTTRHLKIID
ncbi:MAG: hypothetical protein [Caudoviricetes sp.]|nr:MAG: hypothetical protein [Caudoviricetes sp.]